MAQYKLNLSHNINEDISYSEAIDLLNNYKKHRIGQPLVIIYTDDNNNRQMIFAVGKRNYTSPNSNGLDHGPEFYEIINRANPGSQGDSFMFIKDGEVYIRGIDATGEQLDYKILSKNSISDPNIEDTDIVTYGFLKNMTTFQEIK